MATNIEMNLYNGSSYTVLYPKTSTSNLEGTLSSSQLPSSISASKISGILSVGNGGTGNTSLSGLATDLSGYLNTGVSQTTVENLITTNCISLVFTKNVSITTSYTTLIGYDLIWKYLSFVVIQAKFPGNDIMLKNGSVEVGLSARYTNTFTKISDGSFGLFQSDGTLKTFIKETTQVKLTTTGETSSMVVIRLYGPSTYWDNN